MVNEIDCDFCGSFICQESADQQRTRAKQDVEQLLGKDEKKKKKKTTTELGALSVNKGLSAVGPLGALTLEKKPLPGIMPKVPWHAHYSTHN